jgi:uncharacterized SAM-binding protein YcdF (DUF218 family)
MAGGTAIVVPGSEIRHRDGVYRISPVCLLQVREAAQLAAERSVQAVLFTGWSRGTGPSEAEQMRDAWDGPDVELVVEPKASVTAENASRTLPLLVERRIGRAIVVCAPLHVYRTRYFFSRIYGPRGIETEFHAVPFARGVRAALWELGAFPLRRRHLRSAEDKLTRTPRL